ncbi:MAG: ABC transporter substrate-binding protein [Chloroflexota bacterium]|nr:ABC transporter substrate-binding protein [Chloroflexota bacterium]
MKNLRILSILVLLSMVVTALTGCPSTPTAPPAETPEPQATPTVPPVEEKDLLDEIMEAGKVVVSTDPNYAPQSFLNDAGELDGFDVNVAQEVAERLGVELEFETPDWDLITAGNWGSRWDLSVGSMTPTEARSEVLWFTDAYYYTPASFAVHQDNATITTVDDLAGKTVGFGTATTYEDWLNGVLAMLGGEIMYEAPSDVTQKPYSTDAEAIQDLALGDGVRLDAVMSAQPTIQTAIDEGVPLKYVGTPAFYEPLAFALDKSRGPSDKMLDKLNEIIAAMHEDGTLTELSLKWYGLDLTKTIKPDEAAKPFWSQGLRQAIAAAIDREEIVDRVFEGRNIPAYHMVPPSYPYATEPFLDKYGFRDLDMSIQLLTDLGYTTDAPFVFDLWYPPEHYGTTTADVMQVIKEQLEETGLIQVNLQSQNWAEYVDSFVDGDLPLFILGWFPDFADPENWLSPFGSCIQSPDNGVNYCNETMDPLLATAAASSDPAERETLYKQIGDFWAEDLPTIPLFWEPEFVTYRNGVEGVKIGSPFEFNYHTLSFGDGASPASGSTDTIIIGTTDEVHSLDAQDAYATHDWEIIKNTGVPLLTYEPGTANLVLGAAADFPAVSEDGKTYTFTLKEGITFADGTPVTAQDYVRAWERIGLEGDVSGLVQLYVESVEAPDDMTVVYNLKDAFGFFPALAASAPFVPSNPDQFPTDELIFFPEEIDGMGRYRMVSYTPGEQMVLEANPNYFGDDKPLTPNVIVRYFADPTTMSNAVETGEIDVAWRILGAVEAVRLMDVEGLTVEKIDAPTLRYLVFNHTYTE